MAQPPDRAAASLPRGSSLAANDSSYPGDLRLSWDNIPCHPAPAIRLFYLPVCKGRAPMPRLTNPRPPTPAAHPHLASPAAPSPRLPAQRSTPAAPHQTDASLAMRTYSLEPARSGGRDRSLLAIKQRTLSWDKSPNVQMSWEDKLL